MLSLAGISASQVDEGTLRVLLSEGTDISVAQVGMPLLSYFSEARSHMASFSPQPRS
jgi:hypothetical protein